MAVPHSIPKSVRVTDSAPATASANPSKDVSNDRISEVSLSYCPRAAISPFPPRNRTTQVALPKLRHCTMGYLHPYVKPNYAHTGAPRERPEPPRVPFLRLQGRWLQQAGFAIGTPVRILVKPGCLVLEVDDGT
jgi:Toxin SymE, type I toxin-antitoxin system